MELHGLNSQCFLVKLEVWTVFLYPLYLLIFIQPMLHYTLKFGYFTDTKNTYTNLHSSNLHPPLS